VSENSKGKKIYLASKSPENFVVRPTEFWNLTGGSEYGMPRKRSCSKDGKDRPMTVPLLITTAGADARHFTIRTARNERIEMDHIMARVKVLRGDRNDRA
jgi:hypothetical protein